jgi:hypothetical protein
MLRTALVVVRRKTLGSWSGSSTVRVVSETAIVMVCQRYSRPRAIFWPQTITIPPLEARRCTRTGSRAGQHRRGDLVRHDGPFRSVDDLELATLSWVHRSTRPAAQRPDYLTPNRVRDRVLPSDAHPTPAAAERTRPPLNPGRFKRTRSVKDQPKSDSGSQSFVLHQWLVRANPRRAARLVGLAWKSCRQHLVAFKFRVGAVELVGNRIEIVREEPGVDVQGHGRPAWRSIRCVCSH